MNPLVILGPSAAGKSIFGNRITALLNAQGIPTEFLTSKEYLGRHVLAITRDLIPDRRGWIETDDVVLYNPFEATTISFKASFPSGEPLNDGHRDLIRDAARLHQEDGGATFRIIELANGPLKDKGPGREPILQTGTHFLDWMEEAGILQHAYGVLVTVAPGLRAQWNANREEGVIPDGPFDDTYPDDYEYFDFNHRLFGQGFTHVENIFPDRKDYIRHMVRTFHDSIARSCGIENFSLPPEFQSPVGPGKEGGTRGW